MLALRSKRKTSPREENPPGRRLPRRFKRSLAEDQRPLADGMLWGGEGVCVDDPFPAMTTAFASGYDEQYPVKGKGSEVSRSGTRAPPDPDAQRFLCYRSLNVCTYPHGPEQLIVVPP